MTARRRARRHWVRRLLGLIVMVLLGWLVWVAATWPDVRALATQPPTTTAFIERYQERERAAGRTPRAEWRWVPYGTISLHLKRAVLVAEDIGFYHHHGFAPGNMRVAMTEALEERKIPRGASTITQQLAAALPKPRAWHPGVKTPSYRRYVENIRRRMDRAELPGKLLQ